MAGRSFSPEELSALVLRSLREDAEMFLGTTVNEAVVSVPAYFNDIQRKSTIAAAELAGLKVRRLVNEPTAAALAYGLHDKTNETTFLIVDLGGGTFDVSILEMFSGVMEVRSSAGDAFLGGEDFTDRIVENFAEQLGKNTKQMDAADLSRLRSVADKAKHHLSEEATVTVAYRHEDAEVPLALSRDTFDRMTQDLTKKMKFPLQRAIGDAGLKTSDIDRIILVGGATRMAPVRNLITKLFKRFPEYDLDPDTVVALGAAVQAGLLARDAALDDMVMTDICPFTLGYETGRKTDQNGPIETGIFAPLIERNTTIPVSRNQGVQTMELNQTQIQINVFQGEAPYVRDNIKIGSYSVHVPRNSKMHEMVDIRFTYDNSGVLEVLSTIASTGQVSKLIIENTPGALSSEDIKKRFMELERIKIHPRDEAANEALISRISAAFENALGQRRQRLGGLLSEFEGTLQSFDKRQIEEKRGQILEALIGLESSDVFE
jgi:molecular chaperone HscC